MIPDRQVLAGVDTVLDEYASVAVTDRVVVAYTLESREAAAWIVISLRARGINPAMVAMGALEDETFSDRFQEVLPLPDSSFTRLVIITVERDTMSHTGVFRQVMARYDQSKWTVIRMINASDELFRIAVKKSPSDLSALNTTLLEHFMPAQTMHIKTQSGSDLSVKLDAERYQWLSNRGMSKPGKFTILPAGEVATYPVSVEGILVADGAFNVNVQTDLNVCLNQNPVSIHIKNSKVVSFECANRQICQFLDFVFAEPFADHVGELGFGTNTGIKHSIAMNSHINERRPGVHIGFGQHNQSVHSIDYYCGIHTDMIAVGGLVWIDNASAPIDLLNVSPSAKEHPTLTLDEDIDGDCCGLWHNAEEGSCPSVSGSKPQHDALQKLQTRQGWRF